MSVRCCRSSPLRPAQGALVSEVRGQAERFAERADVLATDRW